VTDGLAIVGGYAQLVLLLLLLGWFVFRRTR
jgi:hypothetical protein